MARVSRSRGRMRNTETAEERVEREVRLGREGGGGGILLDFILETGEMKCCLLVA